MRPHDSQSSRENATPSSGKSPLASYKEVPPPPRIHSQYTYKYLFLFQFICITNTTNIMLISIPIVIYEIGIEFNVLQDRRR